MGERPPSEGAKWPFRIRAERNKDSNFKDNNEYK